MNPSPLQHCSLQGLILQVTTKFIHSYCHCWKDWKQTNSTTNAVNMWIGGYKQQFMCIVFCNLGSVLEFIMKISIVIEFSFIVQNSWPTNVNWCIKTFHSAWKVQITKLAKTWKIFIYMSICQLYILVADYLFTVSLYILGLVIYC